MPREGQLHIGQKRAFYGWGGRGPGVNGSGCGVELPGASAGNCTFAGLVRRLRSPGESEDRLTSMFDTCLPFSGSDMDQLVIYEYSNILGIYLSTQESLLFYNQTNNSG